MSVTEPASGGPVGAMLGESRWPRLAFGVVTAVLILAWSGGTLVAVAVLLGLQLIGALELFHGCTGGGG